MDMELDYNEIMLNYYPEVIKVIRDFQALIRSESVQIENVHKELVKILNNAYISTADESQITKWESLLGITPLPQGDDTLEAWLSDRRETIRARLYSIPKLNSTSISNVVGVFTGGTANSWFKDGVLYVEITPPPGNKSYKFSNVEQELRHKIPAHLELNVSRNYNLWKEILEVYPTWQDVMNNFETWGDVLIHNKIG